VIGIDLSIESDGWRALDDAEALARRAAESALAVAEDLPGEDCELSILLTADAAVQELNRAWRQRDKPTNVLSFPAPVPVGAPGPRPLGDIALAFETVEQEARTERKALAEHTAHLIVHGLLHLLGYDHETDAEAQIMEALEVKALARMGIADPYRDMAA
jgi:probable rRNA maturation factor